MTDGVVFRDIATLKTFPRNYRRGDIGAIAKSLRKFGMNGALRVRGDVVYAGNHTLLALQRMKAQGAKKVPKGIRVEGGAWLVRCIPIDHLSETEAAAFAVADNRTGELAENDTEMLASLLQTIANEDRDLLEATGYDGDDLDDMLKSLMEEQEGAGQGEGDDDQEDEDASEGEAGSLLGLMQVTMGDPTHPVKRGDVWRLTAPGSAISHLLVCEPLLDGWHVWAQYLRGEVLFCPYPGVFLVHSIRAEITPLLLVQPDAYIAGHILDRWIDRHGEQSAVPYQD